MMQINGSDHTAAEYISIWEPSTLGVRLHTDLSYVFGHFFAILRALGTTRSLFGEAWRVAADVVFLAHAFLTTVMALVGLAKPPSSPGLEGFVVESDEVVQRCDRWQKWFFIHGFGARLVLPLSLTLLRFPLNDCPWQGESSKC